MKRVFKAKLDRVGEYTSREQCEKYVFVTGTDMGTATAAILKKIADTNTPGESWKLQHFVDVDEVFAEGD